MNHEKIKCIIEAALMVSDKPLSMARILALFEKDIEEPDREMVKAALDQLQEDYKNRGIEVCEVASGYRVQVKSDYAEWVNRLFDEKPPRYSRALLETLAIIAYRQPLTRAEIEDIRGVGVSTTIIKTLQEREWIKVVGHKDVPGRPELLATTKEFLDYFNLKKLSDLPTLAEIKELSQINPDLFDSLKNPEVEGVQDHEQESNRIENDEDVEIHESVAEEFSTEDDKVIPITH
ncbi:MAG: SMC-Scp complex subunit ScpB [Gammaproteobacteria bacterium RIFCSPLOWO2_01_FULL_47_190]|nr:MAG: SMC-Scp complex subunit ScpB [Gammaproteobacteria bacterium RIFCSPLOWO2_01_FULL_47_190]OGT71920.1 MAG: SMC-Scp complex subunit ScpB [Gammaproteobacteria bacterium RIFCSPLOWO2_12_47_11]OGT87427.1 MAG: SMC-Scp complex subunit ScpB [Gammaproteobacteria bacterium RIFCSPLOWO2_12_FULL_47_76]